MKVELEEVIEVLQNECFAINDSFYKNEMVRGSKNLAEKYYSYAHEDNHCINCLINHFKEQNNE